MQLKLHQKVLYGLAVILTVIYLIWRTFFTLPLHEHLVSFVVAILLLLSEILSNMTAFIIIYFRVKFDKNKNQQLDLPDFANLFHVAIA